MKCMRSCDFILYHKSSPFLSIYNDFFSRIFHRRVFFTFLFRFSFGFPDSRLTLLAGIATDLFPSKSWLPLNPVTPHLALVSEGFVSHPYAKRIVYIEEKFNQKSTPMDFFPLCFLTVLALFFPPRFLGISSTLYYIIWCCTILYYWIPSLS